jgi:adenylate cyclase
VEVYYWFWDIRSFRLERAVEIGETALALDQHESKCHFALGVAHLFRHAHDKSEYHLAKASALNPNDDLVMVETGRYLMYTSQPTQGADQVRQAMRRNPYHPNWYWNVLGRCLHTAGDFEEAIGAFERIATPQYWVHVYLAACHASVGHPEEAAEHVEKAIALKPDFSISEFAKIMPYRDAGDLKNFLVGLRRKSPWLMPPNGMHLLNLMATGPDCPLRVKSGCRTASVASPLHCHKRKFAGKVTESVSCQQQTITG